MHALAFREGTSVDVEAVVALVNAAYLGGSSRQGWTSVAALFDGQRTDERAIAAAVDHADSSVLLLAEADGSLVGCCELQRNDSVAYFGTFAVDPTLQGGGIGRRLLTYAETEAVRRWGSTAMEMTVITQRRELIAWYERLGFTATGERRAFSYGEDDVSRPLRDDLEFVVLRRVTGNR